MRTLGFGGSTAPSRQPIYGEQVRGKIGYVERDGRQMWLCDPEGRRVARILRYKPHQAPQPTVSACGSTFVFPVFE